MEDIATLRPRELRLVHINDLRPAPFEIAEDRDRTFPGEGMLPLPEILDSIAAVGYHGAVSLELFDESLWQQSAADVAPTAFAKMSAWMKKHGHG